MKILILSSILTLAGTAHADQCEWVAPPVAARAQQLLAQHPKVIAFCEPCGDKAPGSPEVVKDVAASTPEPGYKELTINGLGRDLAYMYVETSPARYQNLAKLAGCPADGVSPSLTVSDETSHGVLITPVTEPVIVEPVPPPIVEPPAPPAVITKTASQIVVVESRPSTSWLALLLAGSGASLASVSAVLWLAAARRRKRAMKPRALDL